MGGSGTGLEKSSILTTDLIWQPDPGVFGIRKRSQCYRNKQPSLATLIV